MSYSFTGSVPGALTLGNGALKQNILALTNKIGSRVNLIIRRMAAQLDMVAASTVVSPIIRASRGTSISGGAIIPPSSFNSTNAASAYTEIRTPILDGAPISATEGLQIWQSFSGRAHTIVEQIIGDDIFILPELVSENSFIVRPGESILVQVVSSNVASNVSTMNNWFVQCDWDEDPISTFNISGTVTLGGSPVSGAIVTIIEADDTSMTNQVIVGKITTGAGGTWASTIKTGKVGAAFVQYESGGTFYTAPGSPYLE